MSPVQDLNDLVFFAEVVERGGFSAASRALDVPKSRLSRRIAQLEHSFEADPQLAAMTADLIEEVQWLRRKLLHLQR